MKTFLTCLLLLLAYALPSLPVRGEEEENQSASKPDTSVEFLDQENIRVRVAFNEERIHRSEKGEYNLINLDMAGCDLEGNPGEPLLPRYYLRVLVPASGRFREVRDLECRSTLVGSDLRLRPGREPLPMSYIGEIEDPVPDPEIYSRVDPWPALPVEYISTGISRGFRYFTFRLSPLQYNPSRGEVTLNSEIAFDITLKNDAEPSLDYGMGSSAFRSMISRMVVNPDALDIFYHDDDSGSGSGGSSVEYLIITSSKMSKAFEAFAAWKIGRGVSAEVVYTDDIYSDYTAENRQLEIKACIRDYAVNRGTVYVLLGGDSAYVPDFDCWCTVGRGRNASSANRIPTDLFYACLDDMNWNEGDTEWPCTISMVDDLCPDLFIGRAPVQSNSQAVIFAEKVMAYVDGPTPPGFAEKLLMVGVEANHTYDGESDSELWCEDMYDDVIDPYWDGNKYNFYDTDTSFEGGEDYNVTTDNLMDQFEIGYNLNFISTHGAVKSWNMESGHNFHTDDAEVLNHHGAPQGIVYTVACQTNAFDDGEPCLSEALIRDENGGAVAYIGSSRAGWGANADADDGEYGESFAYARGFFRCLFDNKPAGYAQKLGAVFAEHKANHSCEARSSSTMLWLQYSLNLIGDPEMDVKVANPEEPKSKWALNASGGDSEGRAVTLDPDGNVIMVGSFNHDNVDFDPKGGSGIDLSAYGDTTDGFIAKYNAAGNLQWLKGLWGSGDDYARAVAADAEGNIYVCGDFEETVSLISGSASNMISISRQSLSVSSKSDLFILKLDPDGDLIWFKSLKGSSSDYSRGIAVEADGSYLYLTGFFKGVLDCNPVESESSGNYNSASSSLIYEDEDDSMIFKEEVLINSGPEVSGPYCGDETGCSAVSTVTDYTTAANNSYLEDDSSLEIATEYTGYPFQSTEFHTLTSAGEYDGFALAFDEDGDYFWGIRFGGPEDDKGLAIAIPKEEEDDDEDDGSGMGLISCTNAYVTGYFQDTATFTDDEDEESLTSFGSTDVCVIPIATITGKIGGVGQIGGPGADRGYGIATGNGVYVTGCFRGYADFNPGSGEELVTAGGYNREAFICKLGGTSTLEWVQTARQYPESSLYSFYGESRGMDITLNDDETAVYVTGDYRGYVDFNPSDAGDWLFSGNDSDNVFLWALDSTGGFYTARSGGGDGDDRGNAVTVNEDGRIYVTGYFEDDSASFGNDELTSVLGSGYRDIFLWKLSE